MADGWIMDVYPDHSSHQMVVWLKEEDGSVKRHLFDWSPTIHVFSDNEKLKHLEDVLAGPEYRYLHGGIVTKREEHRIRHDSPNHTEVLAVTVSRSGSVMKMAESIMEMGSWRDFEIFSVDSRPAQRFLHEMGVRPFSKVRLRGGRIDSLLSEDEDGKGMPPLKRAFLNVNCTDSFGKRTSLGDIKWVEIRDMGFGDSDRKKTVRLNMNDSKSEIDFIYEIKKEINHLDPDVLITEKGDSIDFPALMSLASDGRVNLEFGRNDGKVLRRRGIITNWSYGQLLRSEAYHAIEGRSHVDFGHSFIAKEGGIEGLIEVSRMSGIPLQDLSRLSPGSAISAIQIKQSMEDGVLVPWKKNRAEDVKNGIDLMVADRGGLYLDPIPGVHRDVFELDFTSLFPSIIATRNISPETMNCICCDPLEAVTARDIFPLDPRDAEVTAGERLTFDRERGLKIPEIGGHTCGRFRGFLGRVVSPIIVRRMELKSLVERKGDRWDRRQNVLKWLLVTCFGYTGYKNARFGRIECHEAICAWSREILLSAKDLAEREGWTCLHAIVDSMWLVDDWGRSKQAQQESISNLMLMIESKSGIPIEMEDLYNWIAFIPSRNTGTPSLTKYFAHGRKGWKIRGIEIRQHSTCRWVSKIQKEILEHVRSDPQDRVLKNSIRTYLRSLSEMKRGVVPLSELIVSRRVKKTIREYKVINLTVSALMRGEMLGQDNPPGRKIHFVVMDSKKGIPTERVRLKSEVISISNLEGKTRGDVVYYEALARRATLSILSPFGISEDLLSNGGRVQTRLDEWMTG